MKVAKVGRIKELKAVAERLKKLRPEGHDKMVGIVNEISMIGGRNDPLAYITILRQSDDHAMVSAALVAAGAPLKIVYKAVILIERETHNERNIHE
jgi:hypothetical protein